MFPFVRKIFSKEENEITNELKETIKNVQLYFTLDKTIYLPVEIKNTITTAGLLCQYQSKIPSKVYEAANKTQIIHEIRRSFVVIDKEYPFIIIKLNDQDVPFDYLTSHSCELFYISLDNNDNTKNGSQPSLNGIKKSATVQKVNNHKILKIVNPDDIIKEGEVKKYSFNKKAFAVRQLQLHQDKLMFANLLKNKKSSLNHNVTSYNNSNSNHVDTSHSEKWTVILLSEINSVKNSCNHPNLAKERYLFEIETNQNDKYIFKVNNPSDKEDWIEVINNNMRQTKENKYLSSFSKITESLMKTIYEKEMKIILLNFNIRALLSNKTTRDIYTCFLGNKLLIKIINEVIDYKIYCFHTEYEKAFTNFKTLLYDDLELSKLYPSQYDILSTQIKEIDFANSVNYDKHLLCTMLIQKKGIEMYQKLINKVEEGLKMSNNKKELLKHFINGNVIAEIYENLVNKILDPHHSKLIKNNLKFRKDLAKFLMLHYKKKNAMEPFCLVGK